MYIPDPNPNEIISAIKSMDIKADDVVAIMLGEQNSPNIDQLIEELNQNGIEFFGGIFPGIIHDEQKYDQGAVVVVLPALKKPFVVKGLSDDQITLPDFRDVVGADQQYTAMVLVDGLSPNIASFLAEMFNRLGNSVKYFGGGAGSLSLQQQPCLFTSDGFFQDAAVVTFVKLDTGLGVRHGWQKVMGPIVATKTSNNLIVELNWRNAFEVYQEIVEADSGMKITPDNFYEVAKAYPFGLYKEGAEDVVRDAIAVNEAGELVCVFEIPENAVFNILRGETRNLVQAAGQAADDCQSSNGGQPQHSLVVDCISRVLFLEEDFGQELAMVKQQIAANCGPFIPEGILTLGEISSDGEGFLEYFNKTIVVGVMYG
jgi:hypothetical protein